MTNPHQFTSTQPPDRLAIKLRQWQPMIVKVWDVPEYVKTPTNKDGMVRMPGMDPFPNRAVRAAVVDLAAANGQGILYPETWFQAHSLWKPMVRWVGQLKLISWAQEQDPKDAYGNPVQTNPYRVLDMSGDPDAVAAAQAWLAAHPEWDELVPPAPYDGKPPPPPVQTQSGHMPAAQFQQWNQQQPQQWQPPAPPQQPPSQWNTAAPPPGYYQQPPQQPDPWAQQPAYGPPPPQQGQWGPPQQASAPPAPPYQGQGYQQPPQAPQGAPGSFFQAAAGQQGPPQPPQPPQQYLPGQPNHHGFPQDQAPPF